MRWVERVAGFAYPQHALARAGCAAAELRALGNMQTRLKRSSTLSLFHSGLPRALILAALALCSSAASGQVKPLVFTGGHRLLNSRDSSLSATQYWTEITVDIDHQQVVEIRHITTAMGARLKPDTTVWGPKHKGFAAGSTSMCFISDIENFVCRTWQRDLASELVPKGFGSQLVMIGGALRAISGLDTVTYRRVP